MLGAHFPMLNLLLFRHKLLANEQRRGTDCTLTLALAEDCQRKTAAVTARPVHEARILAGILHDQALCCARERPPAERPAQIHSCAVGVFKLHQSDLLPATWCCDANAAM